jgi:glycosyltransferase involved in cell wall biosynthesis
MDRRVAVIGPGDKFISGIAYFTWRLSTALDATPILFRDMLPKFLFPGKNRVGKVRSRIRYDNVAAYIDWWNVLSWYRALKVCNQHEYTIIEWWTSSVAMVYAYIVTFTKSKVIIEMHETLDVMESKNWFLNWYGKIISSYIINRASAIVVHSHYDHDKICSQISDNCSYKLNIIPHGLYDQYNKIPDAEPLTDFFDVLFFGLIRDYKGVKYLVEGFKKANLPNSRLIVLGEMWDKVEFDDDPRILKILNYISDDTAEHYFSIADVVVLPYLRASSSGVAHIAMNYEIPIVSTLVGGLPDLALYYDGMFYIDPADSDSIAHALRDIYYHYQGKKFPKPNDLKWESIKGKWKKLMFKIQWESIE